MLLCLASLSLPAPRPAHGADAKHATSDDASDDDKKESEEKDEKDEKEKTADEKANELIDELFHEDLDGIEDPEDQQGVKDALNYFLGGDASVDNISEENIKTALSLILDKKGKLEVEGDDKGQLEKLIEAQEKAEKALKDIAAAKKAFANALFGAPKAVNDALKPSQMSEGLQRLGEMLASGASNATQPSGTGDVSSHGDSSSGWGQTLGSIAGGIAGSAAGFALGGLGGAIGLGTAGAIAGGSLGSQYDNTVAQGGTFSDFASNVGKSALGFISPSGGEMPAVSGGVTTSPSGGSSQGGFSSGAGTVGTIVSGSAFGAGSSLPRSDLDAMIPPKLPEQEPSARARVGMVDSAYDVGSKSSGSPGAGSETVAVKSPSPSPSVSESPNIEASVDIPDLEPMKTSASLDAPAAKADDGGAQKPVLVVAKPSTSEEPKAPIVEGAKIETPKATPVAAGPTTPAAPEGVYDSDKNKDRTANIYQTGEALSGTKATSGPALSVSSTGTNTGSIPETYSPPTETDGLSAADEDRSLKQPTTAAKTISQGVQQLIEVARTSGSLLASPTAESAKSGASLPAIAMPIKISKSTIEAMRTALKEAPRSMMENVPKNAYGFAGLLPLLKGWETDIGKLGKNEAPARAPASTGSVVATSAKSPNLFERFLPGKGPTM